MSRMLKKHLWITPNDLEQMIQTRVEQALREENNQYEWQLLLKQADLATLQSQINPHFLYNTLECIRGMALLEEQDDIADLAWSLSRFFRYSISGKSNIMSLQDELENVETYCRIQKYRFKERFVLDMQADQEAVQTVLPKLTLQPVVENAILHGMADFTEGGRITITAHRIDDNVRILISDNGCGMSVEQLGRLSDKISDQIVENEDGKQHTGIGMQNVNKRLKLYFGKEYGISLFSCKNVGTDVEILVPYKLSVKDDERNFAYK